MQELKIENLEALKELVKLKQSQPRGNIPSGISFVNSFMVIYYIHEGDEYMYKSKNHPPILLQIGGG